MPSYIIATTPRTGSWLLCEGLARTGIAGRPGEYGPVEEPATWRDFYGYSTHAEYFGHLAELGATPNGVIGFKLMWSQFVRWGEEGRRYLGVDMNTPQLVESMIGPLHIVRLERRDRLRQAVSLVRAEQTGLWSNQARGGGPSSPVELRYDRGAIEIALRSLRRQREAWDCLVALLARPVLHLMYEDVAADYAAATEEVIQFLGLVAEFSLPERPLLTAQADELTDEWVSRARNELGIG